MLIVEGDSLVAATLSSLLAQEGFATRVAADGTQGLAEFERRRPDLLLIDLALSGLNGLDLCRRIRATSDVPIIMMSAQGSEVDAVLALEIGADDYVFRASRMRELVARVRAALRRAPGIERVDPLGVMRVGAVTLDRARCEVSVDGRQINLPRKEYRLLELLMEHPGRVFSRRILIARVWGEDYVGTTKTLDVHIRRLRSKVEEDAARPTRIVTVRGLGFKFEPPRPEPFGPEPRRRNNTPIQVEVERATVIDDHPPDRSVPRPDAKLEVLATLSSS